MAILEKEVFVPYNGKTCNYYIQKKYVRNEENNFFVKIEDLTHGSNTLVTRICDFCGIKERIPYKDIINRRVQNKKDTDSCLPCSRKVVSDIKFKNIPIEKTLYFNYPQLLIEWDYEKNVKSPKEYYAMSSHRVWWICPDCLSSYDALISNKTKNNSKCPYCSGQKANHTNCLSKTHPKLADEWHPTKNNTIKADDVVSGSNIKVWWNCLNCGSAYDMTPIMRTLQKCNCPYCSGFRVNETNSLNAKFPSISNDWHPEKNGNLTPNDFTYGSGKKVWWICSSCEHSYKMAVSDRTCSGQGCPRCRSSRGERKIRGKLNDLNVIFVEQYTFNDCINKKPLPFDFAIINNDNIDLLVEYDGEHHYEVARYSKDKDKMLKKLEQTQKHDKIKNEYCIKNNIKLIRIPYWDFDNIEKILDKFL